MTYIEFVKKQLSFFEVGKPIYTKNIAEKLLIAYELSKKQAFAATAVAFKRIIDKNLLPNLRFYQKGIYYFTDITPFGELGIDKNCLIADKYLLPNNGYETGYSILHKLGLTSQMSKELFLATNRVKDYAYKDHKLDVVLSCPKTMINEHNKKYLQLLDALEFMDKAPIDADQPYVLLANYIKKAKLKYEELLSLADKYYNENVIIKIAHIASKREL